MFYQLMSARYANRRTFAPESEGSTGGAVGEAGKGAEGDDAAAAAVAEAKPDAGQGGDGAAKPAPVTEAKAKEAPKTDDEKAALIREVMEKKAKLKEFEGVDVAKYRELVAKEQERERLDAEAKGDFERVKTMMAEAHQTETATLKDEIEDLKAKLSVKDGTIDELTIGNDFGNSPFIQKDLILSPAKTRALYGAHFEVEDGKTVGYDKPRGDAARTKLVDASGKVLSFNDALAKIVNADPDKKSVLRATVKPGAASTTTTSAGAKEAPKADGLYGAARIRASLGN